MRRAAFLPVLAITLGGGVATAQASDPLGFYFGGGVGQAGLRVDHAMLVGNAVDVAVASNPFSFSKHSTGWKIQLGLRPISLVGAEVEYIDFGNPSASYSGGSVHDFLSYQASIHAKAATAFAVLYAPIPVPLLDVYGKAGVARLHTTTTATGTFGCLADCPLFGNVTFHRDDTAARFAYGLGVQMRLGRFSIRGEYERISASTGDPDLFSIGAIRNF